MARILIADDAMFMRETLKRSLADAGHQVVGEAETGKTAVAMFSEMKPDVVLLDINMPIMDGITALCEMLRIDPSARIIMCTALGQEQKVLEAMEKGARDYVVKPFAPSKLMDAITRVLS